MKEGVHLAGDDDELMPVVVVTKLPISSSIWNSSDCPMTVGSTSKNQARVVASTN